MLVIVINNIVYVLKSHTKLFQTMVVHVIDCHKQCNLYYKTMQFMFLTVTKMVVYVIDDYNSANFNN